MSETASESPPTGKETEAVPGNMQAVTGTGEESSASGTSLRERALGDSGVTCRMRNYADIIAEARDSRSIQNTLYISIHKLSEKSKPLASDDISKLLFDEVNINVDDIKRIDLHSRYEYKEQI